LTRAVALLEPLCSEARDRGVGLAFETGHSPLDLPTPRGAARLLGELGPDGLTAWLDTGHVAAQSAVGVSDFDDWFAAVDGRWSGAHVHDCVRLRDHLAPGTGTVDLAGVMARLPAKTLITLEVDWYLDEEEVVRGAQVVLDLMKAAANRP
jgi:sugar phosphate isomerase/epimerase